jgi:hypothetical protein
MNFGNPASARAVWYDRNPLNVPFQYAADGVGPHVDTIRTTYTVPGARKALIEFAHIRVERAGVAAPVGRVVLYVTYIPNGGATFELLIDVDIGNVVNIDDYHDTVMQFIAGAGDRFDIHSADNSTGGTMNYRCTVTATEFDA